MQNILFLIRDYSEMTTPEAQEEYIASIESFIDSCRDAANKGEELVSDSVYDSAIDLLKQLRPDSYIFDTTWSEDAGGTMDVNLDKYLIENPMYSIQTIKDLECKEMQDFADRVSSLITPATPAIELHASMKMNGHGIRLVYKDQHFVKAHTRGRSSNGRDITHALSLIVPPVIPAFPSQGTVEIRGELLLPYSNMDKARTYKADIKSAFTGVSAMIRESASDDEYKLLRFVAYALYSDDIKPVTLQGTYQFLQNCGFEVPICKTYRYNGKVTVQEAAAFIVSEFEALESNYDYFTDGVVLSVNNLNTLAEMGTEKTTRNGNVALKVGFWKQDMYSARVVQIQWKEGRSKLTPVAQVEPTLTASGASVTNVPLYAPIHILRLEAYPGNVIHFRFGGEAGVVPCYPNGQLVTE